MKSTNLTTLAVWGASTFAALWIAENYLGLDIAHHAAKKAAAPKAAKGGGKAAKGAGAAGGAAAAPAADPTATGAAAAPAVSGFTCDSCTAGAGGSFTCTNCASAGGAAAGGNVWGQNPASKTPCDIPGQPCPTVGALGGTSNWCKCVAGGGTTPAASAAAVAYAYQGWAIAR